MAESDVEVEALARLEAALDRISQRGSLAIPLAPARAQNADGSVANAEDAATRQAVSARLDALIAQLQGALAGGQERVEE